MKDWEIGSAGDPNADEGRRQAALAKIAAAGGSLGGLRTIEILEAAGCALERRGPFNAWCEAHETFEFLTKDFVAALVTYLRGRLFRGQGFDQNRGDDGPVTILEIGAGTGRLAHFLRGKIAASRGTALPRVRVVATDSGGWALKGGGNKTEVEKVEKLGFSEALAKYQPQIVLVSWMPMGVDWTKEIRATSSVREYVLVGESDDGCCGHNWLTWGNPAFRPGGAALSGDARRTLRAADSAGTPGAPGEDHHSEGTAKAPYAEDGWERHNIRDVSRLQLSRFDSEDFVGNSCTVSFRRLSC